MILRETYHLTANQSWTVISNRSGYALIAAYNIRNDDQLSVKGIQHRSDGRFTILFDGTPGGELDLYLVWAKIGSTI